MSKFPIQKKSYQVSNLALLNCNTGSSYIIDSFCDAICVVCIFFLFPPPSSPLSYAAPAPLPSKPFPLISNTYPLSDLNVTCYIHIFIFGWRLRRLYFFSSKFPPSLNNEYPPLFSLIMNTIQIVRFD